MNLTSLIDMVFHIVSGIGFLLFLVIAYLVYAIANPPKCYEGERPFVEPFNKDED